MKRSVDNLKSNQPEMLSKRAEKKRVNLPWNHGLFFQVGLIVSLLAVFFIMETSFRQTPAKIGKNQSISLIEPPVGIYRVVPDKPKLPKKKVLKQKPIKKKLITDKITEVDNSADSDIETPIAKSDSPVHTESPTVDEPKTEIKPTGPKNMRSVEFAPVFPGCESLETNEERVACLSSKIGAFVQRKFRTEKFDYLNSEKPHRVYVNFKIDSNGEITDIKAKAANSELEDEGMRVIGKLPKMKPGRQGDVNVDVLYTVPIIFKVD